MATDLYLDVATVRLVRESCCNCSVVFAMPSELCDRRRNDHQTFYCPNGHPQYYTGKTDAQKERERREAAERDLEFVRQQRDSALKSNSGLRAVATRRARDLERLEERVLAGVCPCCHRTFQNLHRHVKTKHPAFAKKRKGVAA